MSAYPKQTYLRTLAAAWSRRQGLRVQIRACVVDPLILHESHARTCIHIVTSLAGYPLMG
jgi:hypothetical protein